MNPHCHLYRPPGGASRFVFLKTTLPEISGNKALSREPSLRRRELRAGQCSTAGTSADPRSLRRAPRPRAAPSPALCQPRNGSRPQQQSRERTRAAPLGGGSTLEPVAENVKGDGRMEASGRGTRPSSGMQARAVPHWEPCLTCRRRIAEGSHLQAWAMLIDAAALGLLLAPRVGLSALGTPGMAAWELPLGNCCRPSLSLLPFFKESKTHPQALLHEQPPRPLTADRRVYC